MPPLPFHFPTSSFTILLPHHMVPIVFEELIVGEFQGGSCWYSGWPAALWGSGVKAEGLLFRERGMGCGITGSMEGLVSGFGRGHTEGQTNRQASLQRFKEKRKDRGKFKMKTKIGSPSGLEMYLNHPMRSPVINGQTTRNKTSPRIHLGLPCASYGIGDKEQKNYGLSVDLNDKA